MNNKLFYIFALILTLLGFFLANHSTAQGTEPGTIKWTYPVDQGCTTPAIGHNGTIYIPSGKLLLAINPNGTLKWSFDTGIANATVGIPSVDSKDNIYFVVNTYNIDHYVFYVYALDSNKNLLWRKELYTNPSGGYIANCGEVAIGPDSTIYASGSNTIQAFTSAGQPKWRAQVGELTPAISQSGNIFTINWASYSSIHELNSSDGSTYRYSSMPIGVGYPISPTIGTNGDIYIAGRSAVVTFNQDLIKYWIYHSGYVTFSQPVVDVDGTIYYTSWDSNGYYFDAVNKDGTQKFKFTTGYYSDAVNGTPAIGNNGYIYVPSPSSSQALIAFNKAGEIQWRTTGTCIAASGQGAAVIDLEGTIYIIGQVLDPQGVAHPNLCAIQSSSTGPAHSAWPMYGANAQHTHVVNNLSPPPPPEEKVAVVLVHGIRGSAGSFSDDGKFYFYDSDCVGPTLDSTCQPKFGNELRKEGFLVGQPFNFSDKTAFLRLHWKAYTIEQLAGELGKHLRCVENKGSCAPVERCESVICVKPIVPVDVKKVDILAHSMGGLIARAYIAGFAEDKDDNNTSIPYRGDIRKLIMAGTPNYGSSFGDIGGYFGAKQLKEMGFGSKFIWDLDRKWKEVDFPVENLLLIGSNLITEEINNSLDPRENYTESSDCGVVTAASAALPEKQDGLPKVMYVPYKHANINSRLLPCEALSIVGINDTNHETYRLARDFLKGKPLIGIEPTDTPHEAGLLLVRVADSSTKKPISVDKWFYLLLIDGLEPADEDKRWGIDKNLTIRLAPKLDPYHITLKTSGKGKYKSVSTESVTIKAGRPQSSIIWVTK